MAVPYHLADDVIINAQSMAGNISSSAVNINETMLGGIQAIWTGTAPVGTLTVQVSNAQPPTSDTDYTDFGSLAVSGNSGSDAFNLELLGFAYVRLVYTRTSGTGTMTATCNRKSL